MINSLGHQTIEKTTESVTDRIKLGPVVSTSKDRNGQLKSRPPFAGDGYYFWEDNIEAAEWWGDVHYKQRGKDSRVFKIDIDLKYDGSFLDLIGNRQHIKLIGQLIKKVKMNVDCSGWKFYQFIAYFKRIEESRPGVFSYKMIRFNDAKLNPKIHQPLALTGLENTPNKILLNPFYIICVFDLHVLKKETFAFVK